MSTAILISSSIHDLKYLIMEIFIETAIIFWYTIGVVFIIRESTMFLAVDIGNTGITLGLFDRDTLGPCWRLASDSEYSSQTCPSARDPVEDCCDSEGSCP